LSRFLDATVAELPEGYREVPPEDRAKAKVFFDHGRTVAGNGNFDYGIEMFLQGLALDPDAVEAHQEMRDISLKRKASGGKAMGWIAAMKAKRSSGGDDKTNMLNAEKQLAYEPGNTDHMQAILQSAYRGGFYDTVMWIGPIFMKANNEDKKGKDFNKFIVLRDIYKRLHKWRNATDACQLALQMRPLDMDLATEMKNLGAMETMDGAGYARGGSFREQILDMNKQARLLQSDKDFSDLDSQRLFIAEAEGEYKAEPNDPGKALKLVDALEKTEQPDCENRAIEILQQWYEKTKQFRFRQRIGQIQIKQMSRMERSKRAAAAAAPDDAELKKEYRQFQRELYEFELSEYQLASEAYPTEMRLRYEIGKRVFLLMRYADAIPVFQTARNDPKFRVDSAIFLGMSFYEAGYTDEADETLATLMREYQLVGDARAKEMYYWRARALEKKGMKAEALSHYSKVTQWEFQYRDVQQRIKALRGQ
jgi:hypothetical protein